MKQWRIFIFALISFCFLTSCQKEKDYAYFMQHPKALQKAAAFCQRNDESYCDDVNQARYDFSALVEEREEDPELFGQKIMQEQQQCMKLLKTYRETKQTGDETKMKLALDAYNKEKEKINILYAVIIATSQDALSKE